MNFLSLYKRQFLYFFKKKVNIEKDITKNKSTLDDFFIEYGSDKASYWMNKNNYGHGYSKYYSKYLKKFKHKKIKILEVGSYAGSSAAAFSKFFPHSKIYCLDINISNFKYSSKNIKVFGMDATNQNHVFNFFKKNNISTNKKFFDIIIDDGSHKLDDILKVLKFFYKNLKPRGYYVIEDFNLIKYFKHLDSSSEPKIDVVLDSIKKKKKIKSSILGYNFQGYLIKNTKSIKIHKGNHRHSVVGFIEKK